MSETLSIALSQCNPIVGAISYNVDLIRDARKDAASQGAHVVVYPELAITGYPPEDLVLRPVFQQRAMRAAEELAKDTADGGPAMIVGGIWVEKKAIYNAMFYLADGEMKDIQCKVNLPNYGVFDEARVFTKGMLPDPIEIHGVKLGVVICEDTWTPEVSRALKRKGAEVIVSSNASPYETTKADVRRNIVGARVEETGLPFLYLNIVGGQDEIVFDGGSFVMDVNGDEIGRMAQHESDLAVIHWHKDNGVVKADHLPHRARQSKEESMYQTLVLGMKDYVRKTNMPGVLLGLSGGIDSALTASIAVDALGPDKVRAYMLPSRYTSKDSLEDAAQVAKLLGIQLKEVHIEQGV
ncbi:MAG: nitrilase-related carbon-nitrogen hydrolase, partial [Rickettsiales bacterium]